MAEQKDIAEQLEPVIQKLFNNPDNLDLTTLEFYARLSSRVSLRRIADALERIEELLRKRKA